jgi:hypothetical protein
MSKAVVRHIETLLLINKFHTVFCSHHTIQHSVMLLIEYHKINFAGLSVVLGERV